MTEKTLAMKVLQGQKVVFDTAVYPTTMRDAEEIGLRGFMVHHVEAGSIGQAQEVVRSDVLEAVDGKPVTDLDALYAALADAATARRRVELTLKRLVGGEYAFFSYTQRRLMVRDLQMVGEHAPK